MGPPELARTDERRDIGVVELRIQSCPLVDELPGTAAVCVCVDMVLVSCAHNPPEAPRAKHAPRCTNKLHLVVNSISNANGIGPVCCSNDPSVGGQAGANTWRLLLINKKE